jgi:tetratricopeptide (TPR) repeat protein
VAALVLLILAGPGRPAAERVIIGTSMALIIFIGLSPKLGPPLLRPPDFRDQAQILDLAQEAPLTPAIAERLEAMSAEGITLAHLVHGNALYHAGQRQEAEAQFERFVIARPEDGRGPLAVGNCRLAAGDAAQAVVNYKRANALTPDAAEPLVNLALAYSALMRFEMANTALADAARLDRRAVAALGTSTAGAAGGQTQAPPLEPRLTAGELWTIFHGERKALGAPPPGFIRSWLPWQGGSFWPLAILLLAGAWLTRRPLTAALRTFWCSGCGSPICRRCVTRKRGLALCRRCEKRVRDLSPSAVIGLLMAPTPQPAIGRTKPARFLWNLLLPGYGLVQAGRYRPAVALLVGIAAAWVAFQTGGHPIAPLMPAPVAGAGWMTRGLGFVVVAMLAVTAIAGMTTRAGLGSKRHGRISPLTASPQSIGARRRQEGMRRTGTHG